MTQATYERIFATAQKCIAWILLIVIGVALLSLGGNRPAIWSFMAVFVYILFLFQILVDLLAPSKPAPRWIWPALAFGVVLAWAILQRSLILPGDWAHPSWAVLGAPAGPVSADPIAGGHGVMRLATYAMVFWIAMRACVEDKDALAYLRAVALFSTGLAIYGLYAFVSGENPLLAGEAGGALSATFVNRNNYATFAAFGFLANFALYSSGQRTGSGGSWQRAARDFLETFFSGRWIWAFGMLLCAGALAMTQSRAGAAAGLLGLMVFLATYRTGQGQRAWGVVLLGLGAALAVGLTAAGGLVERIADLASNEDGRFLVFPHIVQGIAERPLLGHGLGAFADAFRPYVPLEAAGEWDLAHNSYLENAFELGLVAAGCLYLALAIVLVQIWRGQILRKRNRSVLCFVVACGATAAFHGAFDFSLQMPALATCFAFILGLGYAQSRAKSDQRGGAPRFRDA